MTYTLIVYSINEGVDGVSRRRRSKVTRPDLLGVAEIAELAGVSRQAVSNWRARDRRFPQPISELQSGPIFTDESIRKYLRRRRSSMTVLSTINLKGGVGKTTTTAALAEIAAGMFGKRVLLIDLDPQTNLTTMMIGENSWLELNLAGHTLATLFKDALIEDQTERHFDLNAALQRNVSPVAEAKGIDLLPSSLDLIRVQDRLGSMSRGQFFSATPTEILAKATRKIIDDYDLVLIDCPPNLGLITLNGLRISDGYIIPTIPDILSTYGIPQITQRVSEFADDVGIDVEPLGIVITKYRAASSIHVATRDRLLDDERLPVVFDSVVPEANDIAAAAESTKASTLRQRWGSARFANLVKLTREVLESAEELQ